MIWGLVLVQSLNSRYYHYKLIYIYPFGILKEEVLKGSAVDELLDELEF